MPPDYKKNKPPVGGLDFEIKLQTLFASAGFCEFETTNWKLSNENKAAGKFDDLAFQTDFGDILLQAKHKETGILNEEQFLSSNPNKDDFSLAKYIISYKTLKDFNIKWLVLCTNSDINAKLFTKIPVEEAEILHKVCDNCEIHKINNSSYISLLQEKIVEYQNKLQDKHDLKKVDVDKTDIKDFLKMFLCITLKDGNMENTIRNRLENLNNRTPFPVASFKYVVDQVHEWYKSKPSKAYHMTHVYMRSILYGEKNIEEIEAFLDESVAFKKHYIFGTFNLVELDNVINVRVNKVFQSLWVPYKLEGKLKDKFYNETLILNTESDVGEYMNIIECFVLDKYKVLVVLIQNMSRRDIAKLYDKVKKIINENPKGNTKKTIFITKGQHFSSDSELTIINDAITFNSLSDDTKTEILKKNIIFQGISIQLQELCRHLDISIILDEYTITTLLKSSLPCRVGSDIKQLGHTKNYYIPRTLNSSNESFSEEDILEHFSQKVLVITDQPGSGKSTLIVKLANFWKMQHPQYWILQLDLGMTINYIKTSRNSSLLELLHLKFIEGEYLTKQLTVVLKKYIIFDGIDEIGEKDRHLLLKFIKNITLFDDVARIIVTTRSYSFIIEELNSVDDLCILSIQEFSEYEQAKFFKKYFNMPIRRAKAFLKRLPDVIKQFLSIPLYLEMVANIFADQINDNKEVLQRTANIANNNSYELFELFLEKKKEIFIRDKSNCTKNSVLHNILGDCFDRYLEELESLAVKINITDGEAIQMLGVDANKTIRSTVLHVGILEKNNNELRFVHKTFEEYFAAKYIWKYLIQNNSNRKLIMFVYKEIFLNIEQQNICHFIDCILESECPRYDLSKKFGEFMAESSWNENKNILNLAAQGSVNILKLILDDCKDVSTFINNVGKHGETALLLCAHHLSTMQYLVEKGAIIDSEDKNGFAAIHYAVTRMSNFENFESEVLALSKSLHYRDMMFHMHSVHKNLYRYREIDNYMKKLNSNSQKGLVLQRHPDNFKNIIEYFVRNGADLNKSTKIGTTILHYVAYCGLFQEFKFLVDIGADIQMRDKYGNNIMHYAVLGGSVNIVKYLYKLKVTLNKTNLNGVAPIHFTPIGNCLKVVNFLVNHNVNIETEDKFGRTALFYINSSTSLELVKLFIKLYADYGIPLGQRSKDLKCNVLHTAAFTNALHIVKYLMEGNFNLYAGDQLGQFPEHYAAEGDSITVIKYFHEVHNSVTKVKDLEGSTTLHLAAIGDSANVAKYLIEQVGMDLSVLNYSKKAPIHYAAGSGSLKVIQYLYKHGVDMNIKDKEEATLLHYAAAYGSLKNFKYLHENTQINLSTVDRLGRHVIHYAAENNSLQILLHLLELGVNKDIVDINGDTILHRAAIGNATAVTRHVFENYPQLYKLNYKDRYPLHHAVEANALKSVKYFLQNGVNVGVLLKNKVNLLHLAAGRNSIDVIKFLIKDCRMNPKQCNENGKTSLHFAAEGNSLEAIMYLASVGLNLRATNSEGVTLVHSAALGDAINVLEYLIDMRGLSTSQLDHGGRLPIHYACKTDSLKAIKYFVQRNPSIIHSLDYRDNTVLHFCAVGNALDSFRYFVKDCKLDEINSVDVSGKSPIRVAVEQDSLDIVKYILNSDPINFSDEFGNTLLHIAIKYDSIKIIEYFVNELNFSTIIKNKDGHTPLDFAVQYRSLKALKFFGLEKTKKCDIM